MSYTWHATCMPCVGKMAHGLAIYIDVQFSLWKCSKKKEKEKNEERKGGVEPESTSRKEQNRTAKDPELRYER